MMKIFNKTNRKDGMTFIEIMLVVSLLGLISLALYKSFSNGIRVWQKSKELIVEEDIVIFFDKLAHDLRNTFVFSNLPFEGDNQRVAFPTFVYKPKMNGGPNNTNFKEQMGMVEYYYDPSTDSIKKRDANYSQAHMRAFEGEQILVSFVEHIQFRYYYLTDDGEIFSEQVLEVLPAGLEVTVRISDQKGTRDLKRYINIPLKI